MKPYSSSGSASAEVSAADPEDGRRTEGDSRGTGWD